MKEQTEDKDNAYPVWFAFLFIPVFLVLYGIVWLGETSVKYRQARIKRRHERNKS